MLCSRRRDCHFTDTPCLSLLKHVIKVQWGATNVTVSPTAILSLVHMNRASVVRIDPAGRAGRGGGPAAPGEVGADDDHRGQRAVSWEGGAVVADHMGRGAAGRLDSAVGADPRDDRDRHRLAGPTMLCSVCRPDVVVFAWQSEGSQTAMRQMAKGQ